MYHWQIWSPIQWIPFSFCWWFLLLWRIFLGFFFNAYCKVWGTVPSVGNVAQSPLGKPVGSEVGGQDPRPWISSPVGNQACIVFRLLWDLLLLKNSLTLNWGSKCLLSIFIFPESGLDPPGMGQSLFTICPFTLQMFSFDVLSDFLSCVCKDNHPKQTFV